MQGQTAPKLRQITAEAVFRHKRLVVTTILTLCGLGILCICLMSNKYEATAKLLVQNVRSAAQLTTSNVDHLVSQGDVSPAEINTEVDLLESDGVARRALGTAIRDGAEEVPAIKRFKQALSIQAVHQADIIDVKMLGNSPESARQELQHLIDAYFEERAGTANNSGAAEFFNGQLQQKTNQLNADQAALTNFEVQHGIADLDDQTKLQVTRLSTLQDQELQTEAEMAAAERRATSEKQSLRVTPARTETQVRSITNQYSQERLTTSLVDLQNRRTELLQRYVPGDRQVIEIEAKIATLQKALAEASTHPAAEQATDANPIWVQLSEKLVGSEADIDSLRGQQVALRTQIDAARGRLNELQQAAASYGDLRRKLQQSQTDYTLYAQRRDEARISEALDRQKLFNVAVVQAPLVSPERVRPKPVLYMACVITFAVLFSVALALYADLSGGQVYTPAQLDAWTGMRTWAAVADETSVGQSPAANRKQFRRIIFALRHAVQATQSPFQPAAAQGRAIAQDRSGAELEGATLPAPGLCVAFTSAQPGEGVSFMVNRLAAEASRQNSSRVAVLDTRILLESPELDRGVRPPLCLESGAEHWVLSTTESDAAMEKVASRHRRSHFASRLRTVLSEVRQEFDLVLLDCPSLQASTLAGEIASCVDGYVAVVRAGTARRQSVEDLAFQLTSTAAPVLGQVLNKRSYPVPAWLYRIL